MLGIDVSKETLAITWMNPVSRTVNWERAIPNTPDSVQRILSEVPADVPWVLEPTGRYSLRVAQQAQAAKRTVLLAHPKKAKSFLAALQPRAKTDRLDSRGLALYGVWATLEPYPIKSEAVEHLDQLLATRKALSQTSMRLKQQQTELPQAAALLTPVLETAQAQIEEIDRQIRQAATDSATDSAIHALDAVPGIGPVTAAAVASCLKAKVFADPDAFVAYIGLDLRIRDSGHKHGKRALSKQGNAELRRLLYVCAQASLRAKDSPFKEQYGRERAKGLSTTAALCAVARKMARLCWSLVKHGTPYDPDRVYKRPSTKARDLNSETSSPCPLTPTIESLPVSKVPPGDRTVLPWKGKVLPGEGSERVDERVGGLGVGESGPG